ncbi:FTR1 family iron permease [Paenibacillus sacheonensis]|uniref:Iron permease n=1 Tax=Paenibacillus sacheonensis TaxID=742054 RepID=A0A7X4YVT5_9BACL|nr:FTR1 family protein [Paenibacillus sacheonensis]MBM7566526.1 high-affinity iron transporter [Paenibacillus sacheonensis]NBC73465.1 iron permease [Paenibacillus sacheonensis]
MNLQAFLITFREAFEAILIVGIIVSYLNRIGQSKWNKFVWLGVFMAVVASLGVALLFQIVLDGYATMSSKDYLRIGILIVSAGLLTHMILFMSKQNREMRSKLQNKVALILTTGGAVNMIVHSFLVTLREGVETVFFFAAISSGDISQAIQSWGALAGLVAAGLLGLIVFKGSKKVQIGTFFKVTSIFLIMIAAGLLVQAVGVLQDLRVIGSVYKTPGGEIAAMYDLTWLLPEHPIDETNYIRDTGHHPVFHGQLGVFFKAFLGYSQDPSLEEFVCYWLYYVFVFILIARQKRVEILAAAQARDREAAAAGAGQSSADAASIPAEAQPPGDDQNRRDRHAAL